MQLFLAHRLKSIIDCCINSRRQRYCSRSVCSELASELFYPVKRGGSHDYEARNSCRPQLELGRRPVMHDDKEMTSAAMELTGLRSAGSLVLRARTACGTAGWSPITPRHKPWGEVECSSPVHCRLCSFLLSHIHCT